jgi:hypothetical protein
MFWNRLAEMLLGEQESRWIRGLVLGALLLAGSMAGAQPDPTITFTFDFPGSTPAHYVVTVAAGGHTTYESGSPAGEQSESNDGFRTEFTMSPATRSRVFQLAEKAHYFQGNLETRKRNIASTGTKTLAYHDGQRSASASFNYSPQVAVQELTGIFQNLSVTLEFGQRLEDEFKYQKLALDEELKRMEELERQGSLEELEAVSPILRKIANDPSVMNVVRSRAERLVAKSASLTPQ